MNIPTATAQPNYGIDAPTTVRGFMLIGIACVAGGIVVGIPALGGAVWLLVLTSALVITGAWFLFTAAVMLWGSLIGKLRLRDAVLGGITWRGDERVLDVGCGHGLMLLAAAGRVPRGRAVGLDLWSNVDQANNSAEATLRNAHAEGVAERVELVDGDARALPFPDASFDVVLSSWALHNIPDAEGRERAVREIARVVKPGGVVRIVDIRHAGAYAETLRACGMRDASISPPNFLFVIPTRLVSASRPG